MIIQVKYDVGAEGVGSWSRFSVRPPPTLAPMHRTATGSLSVSRPLTNKPCRVSEHGNCVLTAPESGHQRRRKTIRPICITIQWRNYVTSVRRQAVSRPPSASTVRPLPPSLYAEALFASRLVCAAEK